VDQRARVDPEDVDVSVVRHQLGGAGEEEVAHEDTDGISEHDVRRRFAAAHRSGVDHVVVQERRGVHVLRHHGHHGPPGTPVAAGVRGQEQDRRADPLPPGQGDVLSDDGDERNGGGEAGDESPLDRAQVAAQVAEDAVDIDDRSPPGHVDTIAQDFEVSTTGGFDTMRRCTTGKTRITGRRKRKDTAPGRRTS
jgi:hypothetical protein